MKTKKILAVGLIFSVLLLTACGNGKDNTATTGGENTTAKNSDDMHIEVVAKGFQHQFWKSVNTGAENAAKDLGVTISFNGPQNETAIQEQVSMLSNSINLNPAAIALASLDTTSQIDLLAQAKDKGIPIVGFDSGVPGAPEGAVVATAATDNKVAAAMAAEKQFEVIKTKLEAATSDKPVRLGVVSQEVNSQSISDRTSGYIEKMKELAMGLENVGDKVAVIGNDKFNEGNEAEAVVIIELRVPAQITDADGQTQAQTLLNKEDLIGIFGSNEYGAKAVINADNAVGGVIGKEEDQICAVGFDSGAIQIDAIKNNKFIGSVTQDPIQIGYKAVELAVKAAKGEKVEDVDTGAVWYDSTNVDSEEITPLLYE
ncbi:ABC transporter substrate-binding protein [Miniphocaeibacter halophilus]|uniref:ABC transporter substrate-binding protein n=1 Tax=Miniphocaeibacter halophilus TaxID=2931922 RepID=A0AC61MZL6_9FIRM|nr:ABC transporter substrate-binding protein [Miniphocaeibacter halophilus]QQK08403.1 ABC transporter substrate-binding protein [Miniphocaeibacter halophilus]